MIEKSKNVQTLVDLSIEVRDLIDKLSKLFDQKERDLFRSHGVHGLTPPQLFLLRHLWILEEDQGYYCKELANLSHVSRATITGIIDTMEKEGYVIRTQDPIDRRSIKVKLTEKGRNLKKYKPPIDSKKIDYLKDFTLKELEILTSLLKRLYKKVNTNDSE